MFQPLHTGRLGLTAQQRNIDTIGNNLAGLNVTGFRRTRMDFQDNLYTRMFNPVDMGPHMNLQRGTGTRASQAMQIFDQGALQATERFLDVALEGRGFFVVENPNEPLAAVFEDATDGLIHDGFLYTRSGAFFLSVEDGLGGTQTAFLVDATGRYVLDTYNRRISISDPAELQIDSTGRLFQIAANGDTTEIAQLRIVDFVNPSGLAAVGDSAFSQSENSGELIEGVTPNVRQGFLEESNVDLAEEMTRMIRAQRAYSLAARAVSTADQMMQIANAIRS